MEKSYKILKWAIVVLVAAVVIIGAVKLLGSGEQAQLPEETTTPVTTEPANLAPECTVYDIDGNAYSLGDFRGKPVILNFWASWCGPCKAEMPAFEEAYKTYGDQIHFLIVDMTDGLSETVETGSAYIAEQGYTFPVYYDTEMVAAKAYSVYAIPASYFIDANGCIVTSHEGMMSAEALQQAIDLLLPAA